jgi:hypothetical protein
MIIDFRNNSHLITGPLLARWKSVGATDILFTLHHPDHFTDVYLRSLLPLVDEIRIHGLRPGFYTGLLGLEKQETITKYGLQNYLQVDSHKSIIRYDNWLPGCCPNTDYVKHYRLPLLKKAISILKMETIYFAFPWFLKNACYCDNCINMLTQHFARCGSHDPESIPLLHYRTTKF